MSKVKACGLAGETAGNIDMMKKKNHKCKELFLLH